MDSTHNAPMHEDCIAYQVENRSFLISRRFGADKTISQLLAEELSSGVFQGRALNSQTAHDIIEP